MSELNRMFKYTQSENNNISILALQGELTALTADQLREVINQMVMNHCLSVIIDLHSLVLIDSSGVGALVSLFKRIRAIRGEVKIAGLRSQPKEIFQLLNLDKAFDIEINTEEALKAFERKEMAASSSFSGLRAWQK